MSPDEDLATLREELDALQEENASLRGKVDNADKRVAAAGAVQVGTCSRWCRNPDLNAQNSADWNTAGKNPKRWWNLTWDTIEERLLPVFAGHS